MTDSYGKKTVLSLDVSQTIYIPKISFLDELEGIIKAV